MEINSTGFPGANFFFACGIQVFNLHWMGICPQMSPDGLFPWPVLFFANNTYSDWKQRRPGEFMLSHETPNFEAAKDSETRR